MHKLQTVGLVLGLALLSPQIALAHTYKSNHYESNHPTSDFAKPELGNLSQFPQNINHSSYLIAQNYIGQVTIFVDPRGNDTYGNGSQSQPLRTITAALATNPQPGTVIRLAPGTYSTNTGEVFPLKLNPGVQLRGNGNSKGRDIIIQGGDRYMSPTFGGQNITILAANDSHIGGITISNPNTRGYGLWVEGRNNVTIANNTFTNTSHDGVFLTGKANVLIADNIFTQNRGSGISAVGDSNGEIRGNTFDNTGFGLSIGQRSRVVLRDNQIINNMDGVIISNVATPALRGNNISNNRRNGLVVLKDRDRQPSPDLGTAGNPGRNIFRNNRDKDINNVSGVPVIAAGNQFDRNRTAGALDTVANVPSDLDQINRSPVTVAALPSQRPINTALPLPTNSPTDYNYDFPTEILIEREPSNNRNQPIALTPLPTAAATLRYRVTVPMGGSSSLAAVRKIVPDAFRSNKNGRTVIQAGAFAQRQVAEQRIQLLSQAGFRPTLENL
jgi:parallel beta-helix repeat protein